MRNINLSQSVNTRGILLNKKQQINKLSTFTEQIRTKMDNITETQKQIIKTN